MAIIIVGKPATGSPQISTLIIIQTIYPKAQIATIIPISVAMRSGAVVKPIIPSIQRELLSFYSQSNKKDLWYISHFREVVLLH